MPFYTKLTPYKKNLYISINYQVKFDIVVRKEPSDLKVGDSIPLGVLWKKISPYHPPLKVSRLYHTNFFVDISVSFYKVPLNSFSSSQSLRAGQYNY